MPVSESQKLKEFYEFGPFRADAEKEILLRARESVPLQPKTFQILLVLIRNHHQVVTKEDLMKAVWPDTFVEEANLSRNIFLLRKALGESPQDHRYIVTVPGRGYRFAEDVRLVAEQAGSTAAPQSPKSQVSPKKGRPLLWIAAAVALFLAILGAAIWRRAPRKSAVTDKTTVVLADFENSTGDPVFDGTLRQGLAVQLDQSPFLTLVSDDRIRQTLSLMGKSPDQHLTPAAGREVCQRTGSAAVLDGSITSLGSQYIVGLRAVSCSTGDVLAQEQETASNKENTLTVLDRAAARVREKLGESLNTVEKFDTPLEQATTTSLEALQAYTLGRKMMVGMDRFSDAVPFFQRAIQLDPNFAMAYAALGSCYQALDESELAAENVRRAYDLRTHLSQPEKFYIESTYYHYVTGDLEKARQVYELAAQVYPRYSGTHLRLWLLYQDLGEFDKSLAEIREAIRLDPARAVNYVNQVGSYIALDRLQEARNGVNDMLSRHLDPPSLHVRIYLLDFLENDAADMQQQVNWAAGKPGVEDAQFALEAETAAFHGRMDRSRISTRRAIDSATLGQHKELVGLFHANQAMWEALAGNNAEARQRADSALALSKGRETRFEAALAFTYAGDTARAQSLADELTRRFPEATKVRFDFLPAIQAKIALNRHDPSQAIALLQPATNYELGLSDWTRLEAVYIRGEAYLAANQWTEAAAEFQKILNHPGVAANHPFGALAHLQLGRAYAGAGDKAKARSCYEDFLGLWKNADAATPVRNIAKAEYEKLQ